MTWPTRTTCGECRLRGARVYPFPAFEDFDLFVAAGVTVEEIYAGGTIGGTVWCPRCSPAWGEFLLQQMTVWSIIRTDRRRVGKRGRLGAVELDRAAEILDPEPRWPILGSLDGTVPPDVRVALETELADFIESPGPVIGGWGRSPTPKGPDFLEACAHLIIALRAQRLVGLWFGLEDLAAS